MQAITSLFVSGSRPGGDPGSIHTPVCLVGTQVIAWLHPRAFRRTARTGTNSGKSCRNRLGVPTQSASQRLIQKKTFPMTALGRSFALGSGQQADVPARCRKADPPKGCSSDSGDTLPTRGCFRRFRTRSVAQAPCSLVVDLDFGAGAAPDMAACAACSSAMPLL